MSEDSHQFGKWAGINSDELSWEKLQLNLNQQFTRSLARLDDKIAERQF